MINNVKKYLRGYLSWIIFGGILSVLSVVFIIVLIKTLIDGEFEFMSLFTLMIPIGAGITLNVGIKDKKALEKDLGDSSSQELIVNDFEKANVVLDGNLRLGMVYIFGKRSSRLLKYEDIQQAYIYIHKTNGIEDERDLRVVDSQQKTFDLCKLKKRGKNMDELNSVVNYLLLRNPNIKLGYK